MGKPASELREERRRRYFTRGIAFAVASGICYGLYTGFLTLAETQGEWGAWFAGGSWGAGQPALSAFTITFVLAALAAGLNDFFSGVFSLIVCAKNRQLGDFWKTLKTKPGLIMVACAAIGGPLATIAYIIGLNAATAAGNPGVIVPIAALNCAIGAVLGRVFFKQELNGHKIVGILVCLCAAAIIGGTSFASMDPDALFGCLFAFLAAFGWGFEGCVAGFGTILIDYRIGIAIRQVTAGVLELLIMFPLLAAIGGELGMVPVLASAAVANPAVVVFVISGFFAMPAYSFWYKGNSMCGAALGMACNGMYAFWGPFFIWVIMGLLNIGGLSADYPPLSPVQWVGALVMVLGIFCIAVNPARLLRRGADEGLAIEGPGTAEEIAHEGAAAAGGLYAAADAPVATGAASGGSLMPLYYAIMKQFMDGRVRSARDVVAALEPHYGGYKLLTNKDVEEALATAKENGLLDEVGCSADQAGELQLRYQVSDFGRDMITSYIGKYDNA